MPNGVDHDWGVEDVWQGGVADWLGGESIAGKREGALFFLAFRSRQFGGRCPHPNVLLNLLKFSGNEFLIDGKVGQG